MAGRAAEVLRVNPPDSIVRKIIVGYDQASYVRGFKLFDRNNTCILQIGTFNEKSEEITLDAEDRIVGFKSRLHAANQALHNSLVLVIARRSA